MPASLARLQPTIQELEIESLLLEILNDPRSRLLAVTRAQAARERLAWDPRVSATAPGLTAAERKLLESYRVEAAGYLRGLFRECVLRPHLPRGLQILSNGSECRDPASLIASLRRVGSEVQRGFPEQFLSQEVLEAIRVGMQAGRLGLDLLTASIRLDDDGGARLQMAAHVLKAGGRRAALALCARLQATARRPSVALGAASLTGMIEGQRGRLERARDLFARTASLAPDQPNEVMSWLTSSIQTGASDAAVEAARRIDERWPDATAEPVRSWASDRADERKDGIWTPTRESRPLLRAIRERLGPSSGAIADVF